MYSTILLSLLKLDGAVLKSDNAIVKLLKRKVLKPIGFYFRKVYFNKYYK